LRSSNGGMRLVNASGAIVAPPPVAGDQPFRNAINYRAVARWGGVNSSNGNNGSRFGDTSGGTAGGAWTTGGVSTEARNATVSLRIGPKNSMIVPAASYTNPAAGGPNLGAANTVPFLAGTYGDTLTVRLGASF
ncbi:hypothetical protein, partial [Microcystis aeruginosa]|uniref:hypothetical protein n=1 Tax=Microcystis aeruginosa TaxID=1126 RepID=UPI001CA42FEC